MLDLSLIVTGVGDGPGFHVIMILFIMLGTIFFGHSLVRLSIVYFAAKDPSLRGQPYHQNSDIEAPERSIPITFVREDQEAMLESSAARTVAKPPPAYGVWRGSVVSILNLLLLNSLTVSENGPKSRPLETSYWLYDSHPGWSPQSPTTGSW